MYGYMGKILRVDLSKGSIDTMPTADYEDWGGGHGMGSAIFFDIMVRERKLDLEKIDGFYPANVITIMTSPLSGTLVPAASCRTELQGIGVQSYPIGWFTRSNFGGRFSPQLKFAGWDGIAIEGRSRSPVWIDIRDDHVQIRDCGELSLWGTDTYECQKRIWDFVANGKDYGNWIRPNGKRGGQTTQRPAVTAIGPAGENLSRMACLIHDAGNAAGQGGFGAVWGAKNLKAISVIGTGAIRISDPKGLMKARLEQQKKFGFNLAEGKAGLRFASNPVQDPTRDEWPKRKRPKACFGCHAGCREIRESGLANEVKCMTCGFYSVETGAKSTDIQLYAIDMLNRFGLNSYELTTLLGYMRELYKLKILGKGREIDCPLDFDDYGSFKFIDQFFDMVVNRTGECGDAMAEGCIRAALKWGRADEDLKTGLLKCPYWGFPEHGYDPRGDVSWGYGSILGDRDINEHEFIQLFWYGTSASLEEREPDVEAEKVAALYSERMEPFVGDPLMLDSSTENIYSEHMAKLVAWHRYYNRFWKHSLLFCDFRWADFINTLAPDNKGSSGVAEPTFFNLVTGKNFSFLDGINLGRKIWNLDHAIWTLQGRHRDMVQLADYVYNIPFKGFDAYTFGLTFPIYMIPGRENGKWTYINVAGRCLEKDKFEEWKTRYYEIEGWDPETGYPTKSTLGLLGMKHIAVELSKRNKCVS